MADNQDKPILVLGGTGHYGQHIVRSLVDKGAAVRVLSRNAVQAREILGDAPEIFEGDITSRESYAGALEGVKAAVISVSAFSPKLIRKLELIEKDSILEFLTEAKKEGLKRMVYISIYDIRTDLPEGAHQESARIKSAVESALASSDFNWTVLGAPPSMELFFTLIRGSNMMVPGGGPPALPAISPVDLGEIAAQAVLREDLSGKRFRLAGPEALSFPEAADRISTVLGKSIKVRAIPLILPNMARIITRPLTLFSDTIFFINQMLGFVTLLNDFPQDISAEASNDHKILLDTFDYHPTSLEMEARNRGKGRGARGNSG